MQVNPQLTLTTLMMLGMSISPTRPRSSEHLGSSIPYKERGRRNHIKKLSKASKKRNRGK